MVDYGTILGTVLDAVRGSAQVSVRDYHRKGEWFQLKSRILADQDTFDRLERNWREIVGPHSNRFALLHVAGGPNSGIWIHFLANEQMCQEYLPGCHRLDTW